MTLLALVLATAQTALVFVPAQTDAEAWVNYSPPDKSFTVRLPRWPHYTTGRLDYEKDGLFKGNTHGDGYDFSPNVSGTVAGIFVYHLRRPKSQRQFIKECDDIMLVVGGDDKESLTHKSVSVNGMSGREYFYTKGDIRGRVLVINGRRRIFFLQYHTEADSLPDFVKTVFNSFRPKR